MVNASNVDSLVGNLKRINLISGKGGVGRTTLAATLAKASAKEGKKTLLAELEDDSGWDSPLARYFGRKHFQVEPHEIDRNLHAVCLSATTGQEKFLNGFLKLSSITQMVMGNQGVKWFLDGAPAFKEMGYFYHLLQQLNNSSYERIILDMPATGHLIGLARLPNVLLKMMPVGPIAEKLKEGQKFFYDKTQTAAWVVTLPQALPVSEALELKDSLLKEQIPVGGYVLNRAPFNPFTTEEEAILESMSTKSKTHKLMIDLERIRRLREAEKRLSDSDQVWVAPETDNPFEEEGFGFRVQKFNP
jgi:anion-transporting  ArsA/GET3 family ATPase